MENSLVSGTWAFVFDRNTFILLDPINKDGDN